MNERFKELMGQTLDEKFAGTWSVMDLQDLTKFADRFAELIVRECMKESMAEIVADEEIAQEKDPLIREYLTGNNQGIVDAVVRFRNHFGVEE
jgi:hypothetical protein